MRLTETGLIVFNLSVLVLSVALLVGRSWARNWGALGLLGGGLALGVPAVVVRGQVFLVVLGVTATVLLTACVVTRGDLTRFVADSSESDDVNRPSRGCSSGRSSRCAPTATYAEGSSTDPASAQVNCGRTWPCSLRPAQGR